MTNLINPDGMKLFIAGEHAHSQEWACLVLRQV